MTPAEYKSRRLALGLTQQQLADALAITRFTIIRRESGADRITQEAALAITALASPKTKP